MTFPTLDFERADLRARLTGLSLEVKLLRWAHARRRGALLTKVDEDEDEGPDDDDGPNSPHLLHLAGAGDPPPQLPNNRPPTSALRTEAAKIAARELANAIKDGRGEAFLRELLDRAGWLRERAAEIRSYLDGPKPLEVLNQLAAEPAPGYQMHHLVEKSAAEKAGYTPAEIESPTNLVRIPTMKHQEINGWYARPNQQFGELSPREYLADKPWYVRREVGLQALRDVGVLE